MDVILEEQAAKSYVRADASGYTDPLLVVGNDESRPDTCPDHMRQGKAQAEATK